MKTYTPSALAEARVEQADDGRWTLVFVREFPHPAHRVWRALTSPAELNQWSPYTADRDLTTTGPATLTMISGDDKVDIPVEVTVVEPEHLLSYSWGTDLLRWELAPATAGTRLTLHHTVADRSFVTQVAAGWHICLDVADHLLAGTPVGVIRGDEARSYGWDDLRDAYRSKLGLSAEEAS